MLEEHDTSSCPACGQHPQHVKHLLEAQRRPPRYRHQELRGTPVPPLVAGDSVFSGPENAICTVNTIISAY